MKKSILLFNEQNGEFMAEINWEDRGLFDLSLFKTKEIEYDPSEYSWNGDFITGKLESNKKLEKTIYELALNRQCHDVIISEYSTDDQLNNISKALLEVVSLLNLNGHNINKLIDQYLFIEECIETNKRYINAYKTSPNWNFVPKDKTLSFLKDNIETVNSEALGIHSIDLP
jgi:hypothetical protein